MIWNVSILKSEKTMFGYQVEAETVREAVNNAELLFCGTVVRVCLSELDED
ncbi:hypothetical protein [Paraliobacillus ryukyuensis]|uniref:hypothetical protein n=1 Tax=Paraliobacillus ryukyuensis TaxID=200904 RepID=UPI0015C41A0A|nr:hypothetical protein [Paraliobacillus ryukyuensis]